MIKTAVPNVSIRIVDQAIQPGTVGVEPGERFGVGFRPEGLGHPEVEAPAANGGQKSVGPGGQQQNGGVQRGLFQGLQEGVGRAAAQAFGRSDDKDLSTGLEGTHLGALQEASRRFDRGGCWPIAQQDEEIRMK